MQSDRAEFRNGLPMRLFGWLQVKTARFARRVPRYVKINGELMSLHESEHSLPCEEFDIFGAHVEYSRKRSRKDFKLTVDSRIFFFYCTSFEEMQIWAESAIVSSQRSFEKCYTRGVRIGEGHHSKVYRAYDLVDPQLQFVVKIINKKTADFEALRWLDRECHVNTVLAHQTIVKAVDIFCRLERVHIVFEYMRGGTVRDMLNAHKKLGESYARTIMRELFRALHYVHSKYIVHRDVRPDNIFCSDKSFPMALRLGDFGYSNFISDKSVNCDVLTTIIGTLPYTANEICRRKKYGPGADMWSAGVVLYELLCGTTPFSDKRDTVQSEKCFRGHVSFSEPIWETISAPAKQLIRQLLQPDSHKRISALAALQHEWIQAGAYSNAGSSSATSPVMSGYLPRADSLSRVASVASSAGISSFAAHPDRESRQLAPRANSEASDSPPPPNSLKHTASMPGSRVSAPAGGIGGGGSMTGPMLRSVQSQRALRHTNSFSSISGASTSTFQARAAMMPIVQRIREVGLVEATKENEQRAKILMKSATVKSQLAIVMPYRRLLIIAARAAIAVARMKALVRGVSATRSLSIAGNVSEVDLSVVEKRQEALRKDNLGRSRDALATPQTAKKDLRPKVRHMRQRSLDAATAVFSLLGEKQERTEKAVETSELIAKPETEEKTIEIVTPLRPSSFARHR